MNLLGFLSLNLTEVVGMGMVAGTMGHVVDEFSIEVLKSILLFLDTDTFHISFSLLKAEANVFKIMCEKNMWETGVFRSVQDCNNLHT